MTANNNSPAGLKETSMFLVGFIMLLPLTLAWVCAKYALVRYHLPVSKLGVFIKLFHNPIELGGLAGFAISNIIATVLADDKRGKAILSTITNWLMLVFAISTLYIFTYGGELGDPNLYLWTIVAHYFMNGLNVTFSVGLESDAVTYFNAGVPLSSVFVAIYHNVFLYFADKHLLQDVDYWIIYGQIVANCVLMLITALLWTAHCAMCHFNGSSEGGGDGGSNEKCTLSDAFKEGKTWSPFMLTVFSLGTYYCVYPGILPFLLVDPYTGYKIELINLVIYPMSPIVLCILDHNKIGPGNKWESNNAWWNFSWVVEAYALFCIYICYTVLHYPDSFFGKLIIGNSALVGFMTVSFLTAQEGLKAVGLSAVGKQKNGKDIDNLSTITLAVSIAILNFTNLMADGYIQAYRRAEREHWPTQGYTRYRGFKFWLNAALKSAKKNLLNIFSIDVRSRTLM